MTICVFASKVFKSLLCYPISTIFTKLSVSSEQSQMPRNIISYGELASRVVDERSNEIRLKMSECFQLHLSTAEKDSKQH